MNKIMTVFSISLMTTLIASAAVAADFVTVPKGYLYKPSLGTLHDYCSYSPDDFRASGGIADFRGPCARHDICYGGSTDKKVCDIRLFQDMKTNCNHAFASWNPSRYACYATAGIYFNAVVAFP